MSSNPRLHGKVILPGTMFSPLRLWLINQMNTHKELEDSQSNIMAVYEGVLERAKDVEGKPVWKEIFQDEIEENFSDLSEENRQEFAIEFFGPLLFDMKPQKPQPRKASKYTSRSAKAEGNGYTFEFDGSVKEILFYSDGSSDLGSDSTVSGFFKYLKEARWGRKGGGVFYINNGDDVKNHSYGPDPCDMGAIHPSNLEDSSTD